MCRYRPDVFPAAFAQWNSDKKHQVKVRWWLCSSRRRKCCCLKRPKPEEAAAAATTGPQDPPALIPQHPSLPLPSPSTLCMPLCSQVQERQGLSQNGHVTAATCTHSVERGTGACLVVRDTPTATTSHLLVSNIRKTVKIDTTGFCQYADVDEK